MSARLWRASDGRWKWHAYQAGRRKLCAATTLEKAQSKAKAQLTAMRRGATEFAKAGPATLAEFAAWRAAREDSPELPEGAERFFAYLGKRKVKETRIVKADIKNFCGAINGRMSDVSPHMVTAYLEELGVGPRRYNNVRSTLGAWFRWARTMGLVPDATTAPEKVHPRRLVDQPVAIYSPEDVRALLNAVDDDFRTAVCIGAFAGLRSEEIYNLRWEDLKQDRDLIEVRGGTSKTGKRRLAPIPPTLKAWLAICEPQEGKMVAPRMDFSVLQKRLKRHHGIRWVHNGLRHSFGTYRCAELQDIGKVAYEMGTSPAMIRKHYLEMQPPKAAVAYFAIVPPAET
jgi:integrase